MIIVVDKVETIGNNLFVVQITVKPAEPDKNLPSVQVRLPMREDEIGALSLHDIHHRALQKAGDLLRSVSSAIDEGTHPSPVG